ncbi:GNAT family N-acetyltransferase [Candidatus Woesearchaeota archaeon]|nr:GNAT family N-acetyltransferase [Candidatus Woesearchaeota archaeon]
MIRIATAEDLPLCKKLMHLTVGETNAKYYPPNIIHAWQNHAFQHEMKEEDVLIYEENNVILGFGVVEGSHIRRVYIHPDFQRKGVGKNIVKNLEEIAKERGFESCTLNSSSNALDFYKSLGYKDNGKKVIEQDGLTVTFTKMKKTLT